VKSPTRFHEDPKDETADDIQDWLVTDFIAFVKFFNADFENEDPRNYYMEREWRKFGKVDLKMSLRKVVVAPGYAEALRRRFPELAAKIVDFPLQPMFPPNAAT